ncbi:MAG: Smr/MutS family protein, partial [Acidobacteria bacterium]|nr:Smr/MutS family protein [Acidobacteriota bacterium]
RRQRRRLVPVSLSLDEHQRTLLISGPNTGGKTVTMKTVGLLCLMAQCGLPVPCTQAEFPIFHEILADIGDQQSIQESLSTFSAHIGRVRDMLSEATRDSLVLMDELGRATDPEEGGALGVAILDRFLSSGAFTVASTHLLALKIFGANTPGVVNGSMGFDDQTLEPTYLLQLGAPGRSAGLDIAQRLGMARPVIDRARAAMSSSERDIARFLGELQARLANVQELELEVAERRQALTVREQSLAKEWQQKESEKLREMERRCDALMARFDEQAGQAIDSILQKTGERKTAEQARRSVAKTKREFREEIETTVLSTRDEARQGELAASKPKIVEGARVRLRDLREPATVLRKFDNGEIEVQAGFMKMRVDSGDVLEVLGEGPATAKLPKNVSYQSGPTWNISYREVNVIGKRAEEALEEVDKFLDSATFAGVQRVRIVHGHGMGILKRAIGELLAKSPHVAKHYPAPPNEGGTGATIAEIREM